MKTTLARSVKATFRSPPLMVAGLAAAGVYMTFAQGPVTPPGAPGPTMKTLDQIEPRTPINDTTAPGDVNDHHIIATAGSYYLTANSAGTASIAASNGCTLTNCSAYSNTVSFGIDAGNGSTLKNCAARLNTASGVASGGIDAGVGCTLIGCAATSNTNTNATASPSTGFGVRIGADSTVRDCTSQGNKGDGIQVNGDHCHVAGNTCTRNTSGGQGAGISLTSIANGCRIDGNHCAGGTYGFRFQGNGNLVIRNSAQGASDSNYSFAPGNHWAEIKDNLGSEFLTDRPWVNFRF